MWTIAEIFKLMAIASQLSGLPMAKEIPFVFVEHDRDIQREVCAYARAVDKSAHCSEVYGFMYGKTQEIYISDDLGPYTGNAVLVHELTHWLERQADVNQENPCKNEQLALKTEIAYSLKYEHKVSQATTKVCDG